MRKKPAPPLKPFRIHELPVSPGLVGVSPCPGRTWKSAARPNRALEADMETVRRWGPSHAITLVERSELGVLDAEALPGLFAGICPWVHLPIADYSAPGEEFELGWKEVSPAVHGALDAGGSVLIHCRGGLGRSGLVAALVLLERGFAPGDAIRAVRHARQGAIETKKQKSWIFSRADSLDAGGGQG